MYMYEIIQDPEADVEFTVFPLTAVQYVDMGTTHRVLQLDGFKIFSRDTLAVYSDTEGWRSSTNIYTLKQAPIFSTLEEAYDYLRFNMYELI